jgi:hypothetical protein
VRTKGLFLAAICLFSMAVLRRGLLVFLVSSCLSAADESFGAFAEEGNKFAPQAPHYEITMDFKEFSVFNSAIMGGLQKYGGGADFCLNMQRVSDAITWKVTIVNPRLIEVLGYWANEKSAELVNSLNLDSLDSTSKLALKTMKTLNDKIAYAQRNPIWDHVRLVGTVMKDNDSLLIEGDAGRFRISGKYSQELEKRISKRVVANGYVKVKGEFELIGFLDKKEDTLELFVMSMCPFAQYTESSILDFFNKYRGEYKPSLEIRYIFYKKNENGKIVFTSMHGGQERQEDLVQMVIRDKYPKLYHAYLLERIARKDDPWQVVAEKIGLNADKIASVRKTIETGGEKMMQQEYDYVTGTYGIYDGSPSYVWESEQVADLRDVAVFQGLSLASSRCTDERK